MNIARLTPSHAPAILDCFRRVYGDSYANEIFYDLGRLSTALETGNLCSVGALADDGRIMGHMAMTVFPGARHAELGNTVVDPSARGEGLAWRIGDALTAWTKEKGFEGYLHYPTTDHHIMQQQSVKRGFETGLMLGYIPAETDGQVSDSSSPLRGAATIVFEPLLSLTHTETSVLPERFAQLIRETAQTCGVSRHWVAAAQASNLEPSSRTSVSEFAKRDLARLNVERVGQDFEAIVKAFNLLTHACKQVDLRLIDESIQYGTELACELGFIFCGWMPGYRESDVLRLQSVDSRSDLNPGVVNPVGQQLGERLRQEQAANEKV